MPCAQVFLSVREFTSNPSIMAPAFTASDAANTDGVVLDFMCMEENDKFGIRVIFDPTKHAFVVDRGYRYCFNAGKWSYEQVMPSLNHGGGPSSTKELNHTRMVTKCRWIVEALNNQLKMWKLWDRTLSAQWDMY